MVGTYLTPSKYRSSQNMCSKVVPLLILLGVMTRTETEIGVWFRFIREELRNCLGILSGTSQSENSRDGEKSKDIDRELLDEEGQIFSLPWGHMAILFLIISSVRPPAG